MSEGRSFLGSAAVDGRVFMIGGCLNEDYSTTEVWDPDTGTFQYIAKEPTSHIQSIINPALNMIKVLLLMLVGCWM